MRCKKAEPMKFYLDKPVNFWGTEDDSLAEHREVYLRLTEALMAENCDFTVFERRPFIEEALPEGFSDGIYYAYHAAKPGRNSYCVKRGPFPYLWYMDAGGYSGWASIARDAALRAQAARFPLERATQIVSHYRWLMTHENMSVLDQPETIPEADVDRLENFVFYPLQVNNDEVMKLARVPQFEALRTAAHLAQELGQPLVIKRHPLCNSPIIDELLSKLGKLSHVYISQGSTNTLIERARSVLVMNSTVGFHALIMGKPVYSLGGSEYRHLTTRLDDAQSIAQAFQPRRTRQSDTITRHLGYLLDAYFVDMRDVRKIRARIASHRAAFIDTADSRRFGINEEIVRDRVFLTLAHRLERETRERIEFLLASYSTLSPAEKPEIVDILSKFASRGHHTDYIIANTDVAVLNRCLKLLRSKGDTAGEERVLRARLARNGNDAQSLYLLGKLRFTLGDAEQGMHYARLAAQHRKAPLSAVLFYARQLLKIRPVVDAEIRHYRDLLIRMAPDNPWTGWVTAQIAFMEDRLEDAESAIAAARKKEPKRPEMLKLHKQINTRLRERAVPPPAKPAPAPAPQAPETKAPPAANPPSAKPAAAQSPQPQETPPEAAAQTAAENVAETSPDTGATPAPAAAAKPASKPAGKSGTTSATKSPSGTTAKPATKSRAKSTASKTTTSKTTAKSSSKTASKTTTTPRTRKTAAKTTRSGTTRTRRKT